jgi:altronate dehydratase
MHVEEVSGITLEIPDGYKVVQKAYLQQLKTLVEAHKRIIAVFSNRKQQWNHLSKCFIGVDASQIPQTSQYALEPLLAMFACAITTQAGLSIPLEVVAESTPCEHNIERYITRSDKYDCF